MPGDLLGEPVESGLADARVVEGVEGHGGVHGIFACRCKTLSLSRSTCIAITPFLK